MNVASTILAQLGGCRFITMTGAKHLTSTPTSLTFQLPRGKTKNKCRAVRITLEANDTYTVEFIKIGTLRSEVISRHDMIYFDQLQELFTEETGLYTSL